MSILCCCSRCLTLPQLFFCPFASTFDAPPDGTHHSWDEGDNVFVEGSVDNVVNNEMIKYRNDCDDEDCKAGSPMDVSILRVEGNNIFTNSSTSLEPQ